MPLGSPTLERTLWRAPHSLSGAAEPAYGEGMSIPVDLAELGKAVAEHDFAYLVTISADGAAHLVAVRPVVTADRVRVTGLGRSTVGNAAARPIVTLAWPPRGPDGYSLIVDGRAETDGLLGEDGGEVTVVPSRAVLHRSAPSPTPSDDPADCGSDCVEVPLHG